ncbi:MAG TPA: IclR family transcriptional regulator [Actinomycetota bacterium]
MSSTSASTSIRRVRERQPPPARAAGPAPRPGVEAGRSGSPGVHAALSVLELLVAHAPLGLSELAAELRLAKSTLHRICAVLVERGWVVRDREGRFDLGARAIGIGARSGELPVVTGFRGIAARLLTAHNETVCLAVLDGDDSMFIALEETSHPVRLVTTVGNRTPAFAAASGQVVLAERSPAVIEADYGGRLLVTPTGRRLRDVGELQEILAQVRRQGYAESHGETAEGLYSVSAPVRNDAGAVLAAMTLCVPTCRVDPARREALISDLVAASAGLSAEVAWLPAWNATRADRPRTAL